MEIKPKKTSSNKRNRKTTRKKSKTTFKKNILIIFSVLLVIALVVFGYVLGEKTKSKPVREAKVLEKLSKIKTKKPVDETKKVIFKPIESKEINKTSLSKKEETKKAEEVIKNSLKVENVLLAYRGKKPKLVIIIDDVQNKKQLEMIQKLNIKITPSIFPPHSLAKKSHLLTKNLKHFMVHLPMESGSKKFNKQSKTLMTSFSDERIVDRVMELRQLFPEARYVNNHTGSVFTSHHNAMKKLYIALKIEGFVFVDSFTKASSKVRQIAHEQGDVYVRRDIFIDNVKNVKAIQKQLKLAVKKAKKNGYAIAIGHPYKVTMQALKNSKSILKDVELVYIDEIYRRK